MPPDTTIVAPGAPSLSTPSSSPARLAVICDFLEEKWPSMDLNGDLLCQSLAEHAREIDAIQVRPNFRRRMTRVPAVPNLLAWNVDRIANRFFDYPSWLRKHMRDFDLFHLVDHSYSQLLHALPPERTIVTCHDVDTFRCLLEPGQEKRSRWFQAMTGRILSGFLRAAHVICNSQATRDQLLHYGLFPANRITVIHSGVHPAFTPLGDPVADQEARRLLGAGAPGEIRLLSVGSTIPRKRIDVLLRVFAEVRKEFPSARLLRVGGPFTEPQQQLARSLGIEEQVLVLPFLTRPVLAAVYRQARLLLQPSEAEGFGMPLAEAMACGCPVVASDLAALREVGGTVCTYCAVGDVKALTNAIGRQLREQSEPGAPHFQYRRNQALAQAARYSWTENASRSVEVYRKVLDQGAARL